MMVTANMLYCDEIKEGERFGEWQKCMDTPIVPRKMVSMIIDKCMKDYDVYGEVSFAGREALSIAEYAHELLKKFEVDMEDETE